MAVSRGESRDVIYRPCPARIKILERIDTIDASLTRCPTRELTVYVLRARIILRAAASRFSRRSSCHPKTSLVYPTRVDLRLTFAFDRSLAPFAK